MNNDHLRFPIGKFTEQEVYAPDFIATCIAELADLPDQLRTATDGMTKAELDSPYRPEGWTVRQVVHHVADSHLNSYTRFKLALTETNPTIRPYDEAKWAELPDGKSAPIDISLDLISALHKRWVLILQQLDAEQWGRTFQHPEHKTIWALDYTLAFYAWHGKHHLAHIQLVSEK